MLIQPGALLGERFEILHLAGTGGMGAVYRAIDRTTGLPVAVKVLEDKHSHDRFLREAELLASLDHPAIVRYIARGTTADGAPWIAMEWVEGESLSARLERGALPLGAALALARTVAGALARAHAAGIVHRDIKPDNLLLEGNDAARVKVLDFGIARLASDRQKGLPTGTGIAVGTPGYMAPEQARGLRDVGPAADVFSLGCVLFECLAGRPAFVAEHVMALLAKILLEEAPRLGEIGAQVPGPVEEIVAHMLAKEPGARPVDGAAVLIALDAVVQGSLDVRPSVRPPAVSIGEGEQELLCIVMAGPAPPHDAGTAPTMDERSMNEGTAHLAKAAAAYGGRLEHLAGGSIVVTLTGAGAATDRVARAARCALVLRSLIPEAPLALATGRGRLAERWPVGEAIDRAASLLRAPRPARREVAPVRIDAVTAGLCDARFETETDAVGTLLVGERRDADADTTRTLLGKATPCVGRDRELAILEAVFEETVTEPIARAVLITAPAGTGKSRVRYELLHRIRGRGARVLVARGDSMSAGSPFVLLAQAISASVGFTQGEPQDARRARLVAHLAAIGAPSGTAEFLGEIAGVPFDDEKSAPLRAARRDPALMNDQMVRAFEAWVAAECSRGPVVLVLEDLHWGDVPTVRFIDAALRGPPELPLFVLALGRPEVLSAFPGLWAERDVQHIRLGDLTPKGSERLVRGALGDALSQDAVRRIVERAAGNAFYLEELIRAAAEGHEAPPETVLAMVGARLAAMPAETRRVLRAASLFGGAFWAGGVARLLGQKGEARGLDDELRQLVDRELVARRPEPRFPGEIEYVFRHALVRDGCYAMLTDDDRALGHRLAGAWLAERGEPSAVVLAGHFERGNEPLRAVAFWCRAAEQALDANDLDAALERAARGVACGAQGEDEGRLHLIAAEAHGWRGDGALQQREGALAMCLLKAWTPLWCAAAREVMNGLGLTGRSGPLITLCNSLLEAPGGPTTELVFAIAIGVKQRLCLGDYGGCAPAMDWLRSEGAAIIEADPGVAATASLTESWWRFCRGEPACPDRERATMLAFEEIGDLRNACRCLLNVGYAYLEIGMFELAQAELRATVVMADAMGLTSASATARQNLGMALAYLDEPDKAHALIDECRAMAQAQGNPRIEGASWLYLARLRLLAGDPAMAEEHALTGARLLIGLPPLRSDALAFVAEARLAMGRVAEALPPARESMRVLEELGSIEEGESHVRAVHAEVLYASGDREGARRASAAAAARLLSRAAFIDDPQRRASYLERVPDNARTLAFARRLEREA